MYFKFEVGIYPRRARGSVAVTDIRNACRWLWQVYLAAARETIDGLPVCQIGLTGFESTGV